MSSDIQDQRRAWAAGTIHALPKTQHRLSQFEQLCISLNIAEDDFDALTANPEVIVFCRENADRRYIPEALLFRLGIRVSDDLSAPASVIAEQEAA